MKLTLNISKDIIPLMKQYSKKTNTSISRLTEEYYYFLISEGKQKPIKAEEFFKDIIGLWKGRGLTKAKLRKLAWRE